MVSDWAAKNFGLSMLQYLVYSSFGLKRFDFAISPVDAAETFRSSTLWLSFLAICQCVRFISRRFISRKLVEMGPNSPPPQPGRFVSCCGHVPSVRLLDPLHDKPWSFANTVALQLCATVCAMTLPAGVRRQTAAWYFDAFWASKILFDPLRKRKVNRKRMKTTSSRNFWIRRAYAFCLRI